MILQDNTGSAFHGRVIISVLLRTIEYVYHMIQRKNIRLYKVIRLHYLQPEIITGA